MVKKLLRGRVSEVHEIRPEFLKAFDNCGTILVEANMRHCMDIGGTVPYIGQWTSSTEAAWEFTQPVCFVNLKKAFDHAPLEVMWGVLQKYGVLNTLIQAVRSTCRQ